MIDFQSWRQRLHFALIVLVIAFLLTVSWCVSQIEQRYNGPTLRRLKATFNEQSFATFLVECALIVAFCVLLAL